MGLKVENNVALYLSGLSEVERRALARMLYFGREEFKNHGDDTDQIDSYEKTISKIVTLYLK